MAYYKRNGFVQASHHSGVGFLRQDSTINDVKYNVHEVLAPLSPSTENTRKEHDSEGSKGSAGIVKYDWVESLFLKRIENYLYSRNRDITKFLVTHKTECRKVLESLKCLIWTLLQLSNRSEVDRNTFFAVAGTLTQLIGSSPFLSLPGYFPYRAIILELEQKVCALALAQKRSDTFRFRLSPNRKALLIAVSFELGSNIKNI